MINFSNIFACRQVIQQAYYHELSVYYVGFFQHGSVANMANKPNIWLLKVLGIFTRTHENKIRSQVLANAEKLALKTSKAYGSFVES